MELGKVDHHARQKCLTGALRCLAEASRQMEGDRCVTFPHLHGCRQTQHIVHRGLHETNGAGDRRADNVRTSLSVTAVTLYVKACDLRCRPGKPGRRQGQTEVVPISTGV